MKKPKIPEGGCKTCHDKHSWHDWQQSPYCSPFCRGDFNRTDPVIITNNAKMRASQERQEFGGEILQPFKPDGHVNENFVKVYGTEQIEKNNKLTREAIIRDIER